MSKDATVNCRLSKSQWKPHLQVATYFVAPRGRRGCFPTLNDAIAFAEPYSRIEVASGKYFENVVVAKPIEIGTEQGDDAAEFYSHSTTFTILAEECYIDGITVKTGDHKSVAMLVETGSAKVVHCDIESVEVVGKATPTFEENRIRNGKCHGIHVVGHAGGVYKGNTIENHAWWAVAVESDGTPRFLHNKISFGEQGQVLVRGHSSVGKGHITAVFEYNRITDDLPRQPSRTLTGKTKELPLRGVGDPINLVPITQGSRFRVTELDLDSESKDERAKWANRTAVEVTVGAEPAFSRNNIVGSLNNGIVIRTGACGIYDSNRIAGNSGWGVVIEDESEPVLVKNVFSDNGCGGIHAKDNAKGHVKENEFLDNHGPQVLVTNGCAEFVFTKNRVTAGNKVGILCRDGGKGQFFENDFVECANVAFRVESEGDPLVRENNFMLNNIAVLVCRYGKGQFLTNKFANNRGACIVVMSGGDPLVHDCRVTSSQAGIIVTKRGKGRFTQCLIKDNRSTQIEISDRANPTFEENFIADGREEGVRISDRGRGTFRHNFFVGNFVSHMTIRTASDPIVEQNVFTKAHQDAIVVEDEGWGLIVSNIIESSSRDGVNISGMARPTLRDNDIYRNEDAGLRIADGGDGVFEKNRIHSNGVANISISGIAGRNPFADIAAAPALGSGFFPQPFAAPPSPSKAKGSPVPATPQQPPSPQSARTAPVTTQKEPNPLYSNTARGAPTKPAPPKKGLDKHSSFLRQQLSSALGSGSFNSEEVPLQPEGSGMVDPLSGTVSSPLEGMQHLYSGPPSPGKSTVQLEIPMIRRNWITDGFGYGISATTHGTAMVMENHFANNRKASVRVQMSALFCAGNYFEGGEEGISISEEAFCFIMKNRFVNTEGPAIKSESGAKPYIAWNSFDRTRIGVSLGSGAGLCFENCFRGCTEAAVVSANYNRTRFGFNLICNSAVGVKLSTRSRTTVLGNYIIENDDGILVNGDDVLSVVEGNIVADSISRGVVVTAGGLSVVSNWILNNDVNVFCSGPEAAPLFITNYIAMGRVGIACEDRTKAKFNQNLIGHNDRGVVFSNRGNGIVKDSVIYSNSEAGVVGQLEGLGEVNNCSIFKNGANVITLTRGNPTIKFCLLHAPFDSNMFAAEGGKGHLVSCMIKSIGTGLARRVEEIEDDIVRRRRHSLLMHGSQDDAATTAAAVASVRSPRSPPKKELHVEKKLAEQIHSFHAKFHGASKHDPLASTIITIMGIQVMQDSVGLFAPFFRGTAQDIPSLWTNPYEYLQLAEAKAGPGAGAGRQRTSKDQNRLGLPVVGQGVHLTQAPKGAKLKRDSNPLSSGGGGISNPRHYGTSFPSTPATGSIPSEGESDAENREEELPVIPAQRKSAYLFHNLYHRALEFQFSVGLKFEGEGTDPQIEKCIISGHILLEADVASLASTEMNRLTIHEDVESPLSHAGSGYGSGSGAGGIGFTRQTSLKFMVTKSSEKQKEKLQEKERLRAQGIAVGVRRISVAPPSGALTAQMLQSGAVGAPVGVTVRNLSHGNRSPAPPQSITIPWLGTTSVGGSNPALPSPLNPFLIGGGDPTKPFQLDQNPFGESIFPSVSVIRIEPEGCGIGCMVSESAKGTFLSSLFTENTHAVECRTKGAPTLHCCEVTAQQGHGLIFKDGGCGTVRQTKLHANRIFQILVAGNGSSPTVEDNELCNGAMTGIQIDSGALGYITNNRIHHFGTFGVVVFEKAKPTITENEIYECQRNVGVRKGAMGTFARNRIYGAKEEGALIEGEEAAPFFIENVFSNNGADGLLARGESTATIEGNEFVGNRRHGLETANKTHCLVTGNKFYENNGDGAVASHHSTSVFERNMFYRNTGAGMSIRTSAAPTVKSNLFHDGFGDGLAIQGAGGDVAKNRFRNHQGHGISVVYFTSDPSVHHNDIEGSALNGVFVGSEAKGEICNNVVCNNGKGGMRIDSRATPRLSRNWIRQNNICGIHCTDSAQPTICNNVICKGIKSSGMIVEGDANPQIMRNLIAFHDEFGILFTNFGKGAASENLLIGNEEASIGIARGAMPTAAGNVILDGGKHGVRIMKQGGGNVSEAYIFGQLVAGIAVEEGGGTQFENCLVHDIAKPGVGLLLGGKSRFSSVLVYGCAVGVEFTGEDEFIDGEIHECGTGVQFTAGSGTVSSSIIGNNSRGVVSFKAAAANVLRSKIFHHVRVGMQLDGSGLIQGNDIYWNQDNVVLGGGATVVNQNNIYDAKAQGVWIKDGEPTVSQNMIFDNAETSVLVEAGAPILDDNRIFFPRDDGAYIAKPESKPVSTKNIVRNVTSPPFEAGNVTDRNMAYNTKEKENDRSIVAFKKHSKASEVILFNVLEGTERVIAEVEWLSEDGLVTKRLNEAHSFVSFEFLRTGSLKPDPGDDEGEGLTAMLPILPLHKPRILTSSEGSRPSSPPSAAPSTPTDEFHEGSVSAAFMSQSQHAFGDFSHLSTRFPVAKGQQQLMSGSMSMSSPLPPRKLPSGVFGTMRKSLVSDPMEGKEIRNRLTHRKLSFISDPSPAVAGNNAAVTSFQALPELKMHSPRIVGMKEESTPKQNLGVGGGGKKSLVSSFNNSNTSLLSPSPDPRSPINPLKPTTGSNSAIDGKSSSRVNFKDNVTDNGAEDDLQRLLHSMKHQALDGLSVRLATMIDITQNPNAGGRGRATIVQPGGLDAVQGPRRGTTLPKSGSVVGANAKSSSRLPSLAITGPANDAEGTAASPRKKSTVGPGSGPSPGGLTPNPPGSSRRPSASPAGSDLSNRRKSRKG